MTKAKAKMSKEERLHKYLRLMSERIKYWSKRLSEIKVCLSDGNRKIGKVMNVSTAPVFCCGNCAECRHLCYDIKACFQYENVRDARARNTVLARQNPEEYFRQIDEAISRRRTNKYFRWHVAGDILNYAYFENMVRIAEKHPDFLFWTYTKMYWIVNQYIDNHGPLPSNLHVMFSEWRGMPMDNPHGMPEFRVVFHDDAVKPDPKTCHYCPGNCDICKALHRGCVAGETTYCNEH